jgi:predicted adenine nucleotide alpha hydrolase (AANH) superfamily ATPase
MNQRNFNREMEKIINNSGNKGKHLFLHSCCAPCSSAVLESLRTVFRITVFYYNPNISWEEEYKLRAEEQKRLITWFNEQPDVASGAAFPMDYVEGDYEPELFFEASKGLEKEPEGGARCEKCFDLRLKKTIEKAVEIGADYVTTTLTISPLKNAPLLNAIGEKLTANTQTMWLPSDFKKKNGYKRSVELSAEQGLYRQDYCGCAFSKAEREKGLR